jgi:hypothetical protein
MLMTNGTYRRESVTNEFKLGQVWQAANGFKYKLVTVDELNNAINTTLNPRDYKNSLIGLNLTTKGGWNSFGLDGSSGNNLSLVELIEDVVEKEEVKVTRDYYKIAVDILKTIYITGKTSADYSKDVENIVKVLKVADNA